MSKFNFIEEISKSDIEHTKESIEDWNNEFLSKNQIYNCLIEVSEDYGNHLAEDKQTAVNYCIALLMSEKPVFDLNREEFNEK